MKNLLNLFTSDYFSALGWTLLHSLWQASLLGLVAALGFYLLRRRSAQSRYTLGVAALGAQILASVVTYFYYLPSALEKTSAAVFANYQFVSTSAGISGSAAPLPVLLQVQLWLATHLNELVVCWLIGVGVLLLRFAGGWFYLERLRFGSRPVRDGSWQTRFGVLVARLDIGRAVELRETARIVTPMVVGALRPVVLVPIGLLAGLSVAQVEAILAHELAHIRRHDYLVNLVQSFVEVVYFFHPVLWWLSGRIRAEREHCCDDLAMAVCDDRLSLAHALVRVAEFRSEPALVVAFAANKRQLLSRVRRVLGVAEPATRRFAGYLPMAVVLLSLSVGASVYAFQGEKSEEKPQPYKVKTETSNGTESNADTLIERKIEVQVDEQADTEKEVEIALQNESPIVIEGGPVRVIGANGEGPLYLSGGGTVRRLDRKSIDNDTLRKKMAEYHAKMEALQKEMKPYQLEAQKIQEKMQPIHQHIADLHLIMEKGQFSLESTQREGENVEWKKDKLMRERQQLIEKRSEIMHSKNNLSTDDLEKKIAEVEKQVKGKEEEITALIDQLIKNGKILIEAKKPIVSIENSMEILNREAEALTREMEVISEKMNAVGRKMEKVGKEMGLESMNFINYNSKSVSVSRLSSPTKPTAPPIPPKMNRGSVTIKDLRSASAPAAPAAPKKAPAAPPKK